MSDIENIRYELGKEAKAKGEPLHESASESWRKGYSKGFGSNVMPKDFGRAERTDEWTCFCGHKNTAKRRHMKGGKEVCWICNIDRDYCDDQLGEDNE